MIFKKNRLKRNSQFTYIYKHGLRKHSKYLTLNYIRTKFSPFKIGFTVSKKVGNSVVRNRVKRRLRESVRAEINRIDDQYNYVFVAREGIDQLNFNEIKKLVVDILTKSGLYKEEKPEK